MRAIAPSLCLLAALSACATERGTIGAVIAQTPDGRLYLREVPEGLAASEAGLREGDEVLTIDGEDVRALRPEQVHDRLSGQVGEPVKLTLVRGEHVLRVTLRRSKARKHRLAPE